MDQNLFISDSCFANSSGSLCISNGDSLMRYIANIN